MNTTIIITTGFQSAFTLKHNGRAWRLPCCDWHDDNRNRVIAEGHGPMKFWLVREDSRDNGFAELGREELPGDTEVFDGYHDDEHRRLGTISDLARASR